MLTLSTKQLRGMDLTWSWFVFWWSISIGVVAPGEQSIFLQVQLGVVSVLLAFSMWEPILVRLGSWLKKRLAYQTTLR